VLVNPRYLLALRHVTKHSPRVRGLGKIIPPIMRAGYRLPEAARTQTIDDVDGDLCMELRLDDLIQAYIFWSPTGYDRRAIATVKRCVRPGDVFLDLGANVGYYSLIAAKLVGVGGKVVAVEPDPENFARLCRNIELNGFTQIVAINKGISDTRDVMRLYRDTTGNSGAHSFVARGVATDTVDVEVDTVDNIVHDLGLDRVDFIKTDIQGFEFRAFATSEVLRYKPTVLTEVAEDELALAGSSGAEYKKLLQDRGYEVQPIERDPWNYLCVPSDERRDANPLSHPLPAG
jgi:FkbM family methyltransferase